MTSQLVGRGIVSSDTWTCTSLLFGLSLFCVRIIQGLVKPFLIVLSRCGVSMKNSWGRPFEMADVFEFYNGFVRNSRTCGYFNVATRASLYPVYKSCLRSVTSVLIVCVPKIHQLWMHSLNFCCIHHVHVITWWVDHYTIRHACMYQ